MFQHFSDLISTIHLKPAAALLTMKYVYLLRHTMLIHVSDSARISVTAIILALVNYRQNQFTELELEWKCGVRAGRFQQSPYLQWRRWFKSSFKIRTNCPGPSGYFLTRNVFEGTPEGMLQARAHTTRILLTWYHFIVRFAFGQRKSCRKQRMKIVKFLVLLFYSTILL